MYVISPVDCFGIPLITPVMLFKFKLISVRALLVGPVKVYIIPGMFENVGMGVIFNDTSSWNSVGEVG